MLQALSQQSSALTTLVANLASSSDIFTDLTASGSTGASSAMRGAQRREKLQGELAQGSSQFFLQVIQQMHRKMHPARQTPQNEAELAASSLSMLSCLERLGGYRGNRVDFGSRNRQSHCGGSCKSKRALGTFDCGGRTVKPRRGRLGCSIFDVTGRRSANSDFSGQTGFGDWSAKAFCSFGTTSMVHDGSRLFERTRGHAKPQGRNHCKAQGSLSEKGGYNRFPISKAAASLSQEAEACSQGGILDEQMDHLDVEPPGCDYDDSSKPSEFKPGDPSHCNAKGSEGQEKSQLLHDHFDPGWQLSLSKWCALLFSQVIRTKSRFSRFIVDTLQIRRTELSPSPTLFPIPVDCYDVLGRMPPQLECQEEVLFSSSPSPACHDCHGFEFLAFWWIWF